MANPPDSPVPSLSLLKTLHPSTSGPTRSWQSTSHPDPSTPLLATASADKTVNVWSLRDFSLVSTISGGHKRSVRAVDWKDFGKAARGPRSERKPVVLGTGSFDANVGVWVWNDDRRRARFKDVEEEEGSGQVKQNNEVQARDEDGENKNSSNAAVGDDSLMTDDLATDIANDGQDEDEDEEEWHFSTLLTGPDSEIKSIAFAPPHYPANWLATSSRDKSVWIWEEVEPEEWETIAVLSEHTGDVKCVSWCAGARRGDPTGNSGRKAKRRKLANGGANDGDINMAEEDSLANGAASADASYYRGEEGAADTDDDTILGSRDVLASGSYDDTIRLWRDVEEEGDWICVGVITDHKGTVWDVKWEPHINYSTLDLSPPLTQTQLQDTSAQPTADQKAMIQEFENDWEPRLVSCSDDLTVRIFRRELNDAEKAKKQQDRTQQQTSSLDASVPMGFTSSRLPSVIRPMSSMERWTQEAILPEAHVRSVYAVDWSRNTGLVVTCGGDGTVAVYKEVPVVETAAAHHAGGPEEDVVMNGMTADHPSAEEAAGHHAAAEPYKLHRTKWVVVALVEAAHDEFEINHVCWAVRRDKDRTFDGEEVVVSTGDEGDVRIWTLPDGIVNGT